MLGAPYSVHPGRDKTSAGGLTLQSKDERKMKLENPNEVMLDDYEIASFHIHNSLHEFCIQLCEHYNRIFEMHLDSQCKYICYYHALCIK